MLRAIIVIGQLGKIWSTTSKAKQIYQSMSVLGYFSLMETMSNGTSQVFTIGDTSTGNIKPKTEIIHRRITFNNRPW